MAAKQTEDEFISVYEDGVAKRVAREAYRAIYPGGMHTNGPTMVHIEVSRLLLILARWRRSAQETPPEHCKHGIGWYECSICMHPEHVPGARASRCNHPESARSLTNRCQLCDTQVVEQG